ncbi:MAG TPA: glycine--tRNA ligase subunit beta, partial [Candidatus Sulfotelmatobacter sp.]|nr:glycine--tRNA ligase subunit beta [Candidatus Sulfotelmatobacter sp.]
VWLDGLEITQFTYFQQAGGFTLDPPSTELTYGMERILMALQGVKHFKDIAYSARLSYGELFGQSEHEWSVYYLDAADVGTVRSLLDSYEAEALRLVESRLPVPAHSYVLKCSHAFNILDSRNAIGQTERARAFAKMRSLAHDVAELWLERRTEAGYPLGEVEPLASRQARTTVAEIAPQVPATFLLEIGTEELPAADVDIALQFFEDELPRRLAAWRLPHEGVQVMGTPRRLIAMVENLAPHQEDMESVIRGPQVALAFDNEGRASKAGEGFARSQGVSVDALERLADGDREYVAVRKTQKGQTSNEVLAELVPTLLDDVPFKRSMRWRPGRSTSFSRPVRWLVALLGDRVVPVQWGDLISGRRTRLARQLDAAAEIDISCADDHPVLLRRHDIEPDPVVRKSIIVHVVSRLAADVKGDIDAHDGQSLAGEVTNLVETPTPVLGAFDERHLRLPLQALVTVMRKQQRYFPIYQADGNLLPHFVTVANGKVDRTVVRTGNEAVLEARFADVAFFWDRDLATPLAQMSAELEHLTFESRLGSMRDRARRIGVVAMGLADKLHLSAPDRAVIEHAAPLVKFDLASMMVIEISSLAGVMARIYAEKAGLPKEVARALYECELPRGANDTLPETTAGRLLAVADRLDLVCALFSVKAQPTGSADPFGVRRAALGLLQILLDTHSGRAQLDIDLTEAVHLACSHLPVEADARVEAEISSFVIRRLEQHLTDVGHRANLVRAVLMQGQRPARAHETLRQLEQLVGTSRFSRVAEAYKRGFRIVRSAEEEVGRVDPVLFETEVEKTLYQAVLRASEKLRRRDDLTTFVDAVDPVVDPLARFFEEVMVMVNDTSIRRNRLGVLAQLVALGEGLLAWHELGE